MIYQFADCVVDTTKHQLYRADQRVEIEPKMFQVLQYLLERRGELISHHQLFEHCWPGVYVSDGALSRCLSRVRRAIGQGRQRQPIETVHRKGYRFVGDVVQRDADAPVAQHGHDDAPEPAASAASSETLAAATAVPTCADPATPASAVTAVLPADSLPPTAVTAERRQLTVLSCRWAEPEVAVDNTCDVEALYQHEHHLRQLCLAVTTPLGGCLAHTALGEFVFYFGYPRAFEDSARRAVLAGLRLIEQARQAQAKLRALRVGIHTGPVVIELAAGEGAPALFSPGPTQAVAARLSEQATAHSAVISESTAQLVEDVAGWQLLALPAATGQRPAPIRYQVNGEARQLETRDQPRQRVTPFVGRELELALLKERWVQAKEGHGQVVLLSGEPGIGKSRLMQQLNHHLDGESYRYLECRAAAYHQHTALFPLLELLRRVLQQPALVGADQDHEWQRLEALAGRYRLPDTAVPLLAELLSLPLPRARRYPALALDARDRRRQGLQLLLAWLLSEARARPLLLVIEDLHWADPSTLEFINLLIHQVPVTALLLVLTCRPDFTPSWDRRAPVVPLGLNRLNRQQSERLLWRLTEGKTLPANVVASVVSKTDGVPLFIEELTRALLESEQLRETEHGFELATALDQLSVPLTLQDSLAARLDRLGAAKAVAQWGSVLGREFSYRLLAAVSPYDETFLTQGLQDLLAAGLIHQRGVPPQAEYLFKHALIRNSAYQSLLQSQRRQIHADVVRILDVEFPQLASERPELVAQHYTQAGQTEAAIRYWALAGQNAAKRWANEEAIEHLSAGLALLAALPDTPERARQELELRMVLGPCLRIILGGRNSAVEQCYERARDLCRQLPETEHVFPVLVNLWRFNHDYARHGRAQQMAEALVRAARQENNDPRRLPVAYQALGTSLSRQGDLDTGGDYLKKSLALLNRHEMTDVDGRYGEDARVQCLGYLAFVLILQGYPEQALQKAQQLATLAEQLQHRYYRATAIHLVSLIHLLRGDRPQTQHYNELLMALATEHQFQDLLPVSNIVRGWLMTRAGQGVSGLAVLRQGIDDYQSISHSGGPLWQLLLAEGYEAIEQPGQGLAVLDEGVSLSQRTGERYFEPALYRLRGVLLLQQQTAPAVKKAETCFRQALDLARRQRAKWWELRAASSLAQLWRDQGKPEPACRTLAPVYEWFREGFETASLQQASTLLKILNKK